MTKLIMDQSISRDIIKRFIYDIRLVLNIKMGKEVDCLYEVSAVNRIQMRTAVLMAVIKSILQEDWDLSHLHQQDKWAYKHLRFYGYSACCIYKNGIWSSFALGQYPKVVT